MRVTRGTEAVPVLICMRQLLKMSIKKRAHSALLRGCQPVRHRNNVTVSGVARSLVHCKNEEGRAGEAAGEAATVTAARRPASPQSRFTASHLRAH